VNALFDLFHHKTWATLKLIEHCRKFDEEGLSAEMPGTYGSIIATLNHLVHADIDYIRMLEGGPEPEVSPASLDVLAERFQAAVPRWEKALSDEGIQDSEITLDDGYRMRGSVPIAQSIHHAEVHRTHVLSILGGKGYESPELDIWAYAMEAELAREPEEASPG
jgi:uncharacterized damage-inducible protein DinB